MLTARLALKIARDAHEGQARKHGGDYIWHCVAVAQDPLVMSQGEWLYAAALLHDVVEDTDWTFEKLVSYGASEDQIKVIDLVTHPEGMSNADYLARILRSHTGSIVKLADSKHNYEELPFIMTGPPSTKSETTMETYNRLRTKYQANIKRLEGDDGLRLPLNQRTAFLEDRVSDVS